MTFKQFLAKLLRVPRRLRQIFYLRWNRFVFWTNGVTVGENMQVCNKFYLQKHPDSQLRIGNNFTFYSGSGYNALARNIYGSITLQLPNTVVEIGDDTGISCSAIRAKERITIGSRVNIGGDCILMDTDAHNLDYRVRASREMIGKFSKDSVTAASAPIVIEDDVLIGTRCIILKGVTIGARSIIGSGSVVTKSIPADCIAAGNPCRVIRYCQK
jgi:carbonic anhydrase/acetyltransferase-like protein (isoleucine patch superfamily)